MPQQISRLLVLFLLFTLCLVMARHYLVPKTFGRLGHYRAAALDSIVSRNVKYVGRKTCATCHDDIAKLHSVSRHQTVACEACHGPGSKHEEIAKPFTNVKKLSPEQEKLVRDSIWKIQPGNICSRCHISQGHKEHPKYEK